MKFDKLKQRLFDTHGIALEYDDKVADRIADRCLEVETGARNIDHIMEGTILPLISEKLLSGLSQGEQTDTIRLEVLQDNSFSIGDK